MAAVATEPSIEQAAPLSPRKRKRPTPDASPISDRDVDEPARKRSASSKVNGGANAVATTKGGVDEAEGTVGTTRAATNGRDEDMADVAEAAQDFDEEESAPLKPSKAKKGKRKGKKAKELDIVEPDLPETAERQADAEVEDEPVPVGEERGWLL